MLFRTASVSVLACCLALTATTHAAPLDPADVAKDAKWVLHVDFEALADSKVADKAGDKWPEKAKKLRKRMESEFGVTPQEDLKSLTMFSNKYEKHSGVAILTANFNRSKVKESLKSKDDVKQTEWQDYTLYTYDVSKHKMKDHKAKDDDKNASKDKDKNRDKDTTKKDKGATKSVTSVIVDRKTLLCAASPERVKWALKVLDGDAASLDEQGESRLTKAPMHQSLIWAAAIELEGLPKAGGALAVLRQHEKIQYSLRSSDGTLNEEYTFIAVNEEIAKKMKEAVQGLIALGEVWTANAEELNQMLDQTEIDQDGTRVTVSWKGSAGEALTAVERVAQLADDWKDNKHEKK